MAAQAGEKQGMGDMLWHALQGAEGSGMEKTGNF